MQPYYQASDMTLYLGDVREMLSQLEPESVHCVVTSPPYYGLRSYLPAVHPDKAREIGSEGSVEAYVAALVDVFGQIKRVLRGDGTCWVNLGDSYAGGGHGPTGDLSLLKQRGRTAYEDRQGFVNRCTTPTGGLKPKDLTLAPFRFALALQADGWWVRQTVVWYKGNPMPESVVDRPTTSHEYIFLLSKEGHYYYDQEAVREPSRPEQEAHNRRYAKPYQASDGRAGYRQPNNTNHLGIHGRPGPGGRNCRSVWSLSSEPLADAHYASYPTEVPRRAILAGTPERGCCPACLAPWRRVVETGCNLHPGSSHTGQYNMERGNRQMHASGKASGTITRERWDARTANTTLGWAPGCECGHSETVPAVVLDPFSGSGTTAVVARQLGRRGIGIDLSEEYHKIAIKRIEATTPSLLAPGQAEQAEQAATPPLFGGGG